VGHHCGRLHHAIFLCAQNLEIVHGFLVYLCTCGLNMLINEINSAFDSHILLSLNALLLIHCSWKFSIRVCVILGSGAFLRCCTALIASLLPTFRNKLLTSY